jgi:uncharacterized protein YabE (DUF348 family)
VADNRRTSTRHDVSLAAKLTLDGNQREATVMNISLGGALVNAGAKLAMGQRVQISFAVPTLETPIEVTATVRWSDAKTTGLQFDGLRARDVWALNKYFEQLPASS